MMIKHFVSRFSILFLTVVILVSLSCKHRPAIEPVQPQEVYDVINTVIKERILDTAHRKPNQQWRLDPKLWKIEVDFSKPSDKTDTADEQPAGTINYYELLTTVFSRADSDFFVYQASHPDRFILQKGKIKLVNLRGSVSVKNQDTTIRYSELSFSIPIFSKDHQSAWVGAEGPWEYYLVKIEGRWRIKIIKARWQLAGEREHIETRVLF